jgi:hypothetical protein
MENENHNGSSPASDRARPRRNDLSLTEIIQEQPVTGLAVAMAAGFILGGGMRSTNGLALLALIGQVAMRDALGTLVSDALRGQS